MKTIELTILNPKVEVILKDMVKKNWITIQKPSKNKSVKKKLNLKPKTWEAQFKKAIANGDTPEKDFYS
jgi:hypothetical protein